MQTMTELVQERAHLVVGEQRRLVCGGSCKVHHVHDMRTMVFLMTDELRLEIIHPGATALAVPRMEVHIIYR